MSNYVKSTDFAAKDALTTGNPLKLIKGTEINDEFNNLQTSIATKADLSSPALSGNPTAPTQAVGNNSTRIANTAFVQQEIADAETAIAITGGNISGTNITDVIITDADISGLVTPIAVADGGTGVNTFTANNVILGNGTSSLNGNIVSPASAGNVLTADGTTWVSSPKITLGTAQITTSGTSIEFTSIPSWARKITVMFSGVSTNSSSLLLIQIGSGSYTNTGYVSSSGYATSTGAARFTSSFGYAQATMSNPSTISGTSTIYLLSGNTYVNSGNLDNNGGGTTNFCGGTVTLGGTLDRLRIIGSNTGNPVDTFDAGTINIIYE